LARRRQSFPGYCFSELIDLFCLADGKVGQLVMKSNCVASTIQTDIVIFLNTDCTNDNTKNTNRKQLIINDCCNFHVTSYIINPRVGRYIQRHISKKYEFPKKVATNLPDSLGKI